MALLKRSKPSGTRDPEGRMPLKEHLRELRSRIIKALLGVAAGIVAGFIFFDPIWRFVKEPYCGLPQEHMLKPGQCSLAVQGVFESFFVNLKVATLFALVVASPVWLYQIWAFVAPGLYRNERRYTLTFLGLAIPLFLAGTALAYFVMDTGLAILFSFAPPDTTLVITINEYLGYALAMLLIFGVSFELPLLLVFLNLIGVLSHAAVAKHRRMIIFVMFVFGAVATPGGDPFTMIALALPMVVLFLLAELVMYLRDKRRAVAEAERRRLLEEELRSAD